MNCVYDILFIHKQQACWLFRLVARCIHCQAMFDLADCVKRGASFACKPCNTARAAVQKEYKSRNQMHLWKRMTKAEQRAEIAANRGKSLGKGKKFPVELSEKASACCVCEAIQKNSSSNTDSRQQTSKQRLNKISHYNLYIIQYIYIYWWFASWTLDCGQVEIQDAVHLQKAKEYVNFRQFRKEAKTRWGLNKKEAGDQWRLMLGDPSVPKSRDQMNWTTMPALHIFRSRAQFHVTRVDSFICFLLKLLFLEHEVSRGTHNEPFEGWSDA